MLGSTLDILNENYSVWVYFEELEGIKRYLEMLYFIPLQFKKVWTNNWFSPKIKKLRPIHWLYWKANRMLPFSKQSNIAAHSTIRENKE